MVQGKSALINGNAQDRTREPAVPRGARQAVQQTLSGGTLNPFPDLFTMPPGGVSSKVKDALLKKGFTDRQIDVAYAWLTRDDHDAMGGMLGFASYGGRVNAVAADATASAQRGAILDMAFNASGVSWPTLYYKDNLRRLQAAKQQWDPRNVFTHALGIAPR